MTTAVVVYNGKTFPKALANFIINDMMGICNKHKVKVHDCGIEPHELAMGVTLMWSGMLTKTQLRNIVEQAVIIHKEKLQDGTK